MATTTDQIQADIARTRARMADGSAGARYSQTGYSPSLTDNISNQIKEHPLMALGLSLLAGSLLKDYLGGQSGSTMTNSQGGYTSSYGTAPYTGTATSAANAVGRGIDNATDFAGDAVRSAGDAAMGVAQNVADTTAGVARQVADTTGNVVHEVRETAGEAAEQVSDTFGDLTATISDQVRRHPIATIALGLYAGSLLKGSLGGQTRSTGYTGRTGPYGTTYATGMTPTYGSSAYDDFGAYRPGMGTSTAGDTVRAGVVNAADTVGDAAQQVADTTRNVASSAVDTAQDIAGSVADTTVNAARQVADTTSNVAGQVAETASDAAHEVAERANDFYSNLSSQVQERPLTALGIAIGAGMLLRPTLQPHISAFTQDIVSPVKTAGSSVGQLVALPEQDELRTIREKLVPATVERAQQFTGRELRDYLETSLEGVVGQTSLRAGVVAAVTEKAEELVTNRLPGTLERTLRGTPGLIAIALAGALLQARSEAQQGQGQTLTNVKDSLAQSLTQNAKDQLMRHFPTFRAQYESTNGGTRRCSNCSTELNGDARFCPSCGTPA